MSRADWRVAGKGRRDQDAWVRTILKSDFHLVVGSHPDLSKKSVYEVACEREVGPRPEAFVHVPRGRWPSEPTCHECMAYVKQTTTRAKSKRADVVLVDALLGIDE